MLAYELDIDKIGASRGHHGFGMFVLNYFLDLDDLVECLPQLSGTPPYTFYKL